MMHIDLDIIVYAVIAALILGRLWFVLGTKNEDETQRPNPFTQPPPKAPTETVAYPPMQAATSRMLPFSPPAASLAGGLAQVAAVDITFNEKLFLQNARDIFSVIVSAYAAGNMNSIAEFLSPDLLSHLQKNADARTAEGQTAQSRVMLIKDAEVVSARTEGSWAFVTTKFVSNQENVLRDRSGTIIGGQEGKTEEVTDIWTFGKDTSSTIAKWVVVETHA